MKTYIIGGTGLLGSQTAKELLERGHSVKAIALPPAPPGAELPEGMELEYGDYTKLTDAELKERLNGCEGLVFAAGIDERIEAPPSIYDLFMRHNVAPLKRLLGIAKECGVKHVAVCGSYFSHFTKTRPEEHFIRYHSYIKCRIEQEELCMSMASPGFDVAVLELPYIFGAMKGRKPVWVFGRGAAQNEACDLLLQGRHDYGHGPSGRTGYGGGVRAQQGR